jgi:16S rRNA (guanine(527)-N(7))-methyltransferase RsmG
MTPTLPEFSQAITQADLGLDKVQVSRAAAFAFILHQENKVQNLTRIIGVKEFIEGHLIDTLELLKLPTLGLEVMDIGAGTGVPGLLAACLDSNPERSWLLIESEIGKVEYLNRSAELLKLPQVEIFHGRAEEHIKKLEPDTVIARAVGTVDKISNWIWNCSTWNNLILFKSRGWEEEWKSAQTTRFGKKLTVTHTSDYSDSERTRYLISLSRNKK